MTTQRQQVFQKLRPPCVELSSIALQFKADRTSIKQVFHALRTLRDVLIGLGTENLLDEKLAEYAFFPLSHIFNESRKLSSVCLELAVQSVTVLVSKGWTQQLIPEMGKQLLILMTLLAGGDRQKRNEQPSDELKTAAFECVGSVFGSLRLSTNGLDIFSDVATKSILDQLVYILLESIESSTSDLTQVSAATAMLELEAGIEDRILLASLLPRTISALTKSLRASTQARRTQKVLIAYLHLVTAFLRSTLADRFVLSSISSDLAKAEKDSDAIVLDQSWLRATAPQVKTALIQIVKLRNHEASNVRQALMELCLMIIEDCSKSLPDTLPLMVETLISLVQNDEKRAFDLLKHLSLSRLDVADILKAKFFDWSQSLPRVMLGNDDRPKNQMLKNYATSFSLIANDVDDQNQLSSRLAKTLLDSISAIESTGHGKVEQIETTNSKLLANFSDDMIQSSNKFKPVVLSHQSQVESSKELKNLIRAIHERGYGNLVARSLVDSISNTESQRHIASIWLALSFLDLSKGAIDLNDMINVIPSAQELMTSQPFLTSDLYALTLPYLLDYTNFDREKATDWRLNALALECLVLQAEQLGPSYRPELAESLYPALALLGSRDYRIQHHAMTALNHLATACRYSSTSDMLIKNVDYLVNSISMKLNGFDISPQAPQVLLMMIRLCGARLTPYLDDVIASIFGAIDNFHGYPRLIETLFEVLRAIVEENTKPNSSTTITDGPSSLHEKKAALPTDIDAIFQDLRDRKSRRRKSEDENEVNFEAPRRPWSMDLNGDQAEASDDESRDEETEELSSLTANTDEKRSLSKSNTLLLNIAQATTPHLASPSPHVRHTLLQLLIEVSPLLARDEDSFLPFINASWPTIISLLLNPQETEHETIYNACAAAELMSQYCVSAGDFMASRVEEIFPRVEKLFSDVSARLTSSNESQATTSSGRNKISTSNTEVMISNYKEKRLNHVALVPTSGSHRPSETRLLNSLIDLLVTITSHVRLTDDNGDKIINLLAPLMKTDRGNMIRNGLQKYNSDALWVHEAQYGISE